MIKNIVLSFLVLGVIASCSKGIDDANFRNTNYVFYQEEGGKGYWQKISKTSDFKYKKGQLTYFYANGNTFAKVEILDSFPNRIEQFHNKRGELIKTVWKKNDTVIKRYLENGYHQFSYSNKGNIYEEGLVANHLRQGTWKRYNTDDGFLEQIAELKDNQEHGKIENYWSNGNLKNISYWDEGEQIGDFTLYYENGNIHQKYGVKNTKGHGSIEEYYPNKALKFTGVYWNGILKDTAKTYYENGVLKNLKIRTLDTITKITTGIEYRYFPNGELEAKSDTKNGLPDGIRVSYYENGNIKDWGEYNQNKIDGKFTFYYESGIKKMEGAAKIDRFVSNVKYFNERGKLTKTMIVENGQFIDSILH